MVHMFVQPSMKMLKLENVIHSINVLDMSRRKKKKNHVRVLIGLCVFLLPRVAIIYEFQSRKSSTPSMKNISFWSVT